MLKIWRKSVVVRELSPMTMTAFFKVEIMLAALTGKSDLAGSKGRWNAFPLLHEQLLSSRELTQAVNVC